MQVSRMYCVGIDLGQVCLALELFELKRILSCIDLEIILEIIYAFMQFLSV